MNVSTEVVIIGYMDDGEPIYWIRGGAPDDDDDEGDDIEVDGDDDSDGDGDDDSDDDGDGDDDTDDDDKEKGKGKPKPPEKKAPAKVAPKKVPPLKAGATKEQRLARSVRIEREAKQAAQRQLQVILRQNETEAEKRDREATEAAEAKYKPIAVGAAARAAFLEAGIKGDAARGIRLLDLTTLEVDGADVLGLEEQVEIIKADYPEMFGDSDDDDERPKRRPAPKGKINGGNRKPSDSTNNGGKKLTSAELIEKRYQDGDYAGL